MLTQKFLIVLHFEEKFISDMKMIKDFHLIQLFMFVKFPFFDFSMKCLKKEACTLQTIKLKPKQKSQFKQNEKCEHE